MTSLSLLVGRTVMRYHKFGSGPIISDVSLSQVPSVYIFGSCFKLKGYMQLKKVILTISFMDIHAKLHPLWVINKHSRLYIEQRN